MKIKTIAAGRYPAAICNDAVAASVSGRHYSTVLDRFHCGDAFSGGEVC
jgi:hypothetical protein